MLGSTLGVGSSPSLDPAEPEGRVGENTERPPRRGGGGGGETCIVARHTSADQFLCTATGRRPGIAGRPSVVVPAQSRRQRPPHRVHVCRGG